MRIIITILFLLLTVICYADIDKPNILIRKSDNKVIGVGYSNFEGIKNPNKYKVQQIELSEMAGYSGQMAIDIEEEVKNQKEEKEGKKDKAKNKLKSLGFTDEEIEGLF